MSSQTPPDSDEQSGGSLTPIVDAISDMASNTVVPAAIQRTAVKAFSQLCAAAIEIPVAYLEGTAAEKRAETQARVKIITTGADQIATQMNVDPEFARIAVRKYGQKIVREQVNLDRISEVAAIQLQAEAALPGDASQNRDDVPPIDDDWLNSFEKEASQKSTEEMQRLFGKILAGEIRKPSSFSIKTVKLIGQLDSQVAQLFRLLCSISVSLRVGGVIHDARVVSLGGNAASNSLLQYGLSFAKLNVLQEHGLIISDYHSYMGYGMCVAADANLALPLRYQNRNWILRPISAANVDRQLLLHGVALSVSGVELMDIVDIQANETYTAAFETFLKARNLTLVEV